MVNFKLFKNLFISFSFSLALTVRENINFNVLQQKNCAIYNFLYCYSQNLAFISLKFVLNQKIIECKFWQSFCDHLKAPFVCSMQCVSDMQCVNLVQQRYVRIVLSPLDSETIRSGDFSQISQICKFKRITLNIIIFLLQFNNN